MCLILLYFNKLINCIYSLKRHAISYFSHFSVNLCFSLSSINDLPCSPDWPESHCVLHAGFKLLILLPSLLSVSPCLTTCISCLIASQFEKHTQRERERERDSILHSNEPELVSNIFPDFNG
jgi:hypothetical protein